MLLPNGKEYGQTGKLDFVNNTIDQNTDTLLLRGIIGNPPLPGVQANGPDARELADGEFVTVLVQSVEPIEVLAVPRAAILTNQQGDFVYVVGADNKAEQRRVQLGQSTPTTAVVLGGLKEGELVVADGIQRVRPGQPVSPGPIAPQPAALTPSSGNGTPTAGQGTSGPAANGGPAAGGAVPAGQGSSGPASGAVTPPAQGQPANR